MVVVILLLAILFFDNLSYTYATTGIQYRQIDFSKQTGRSRMARYACAKMYNSVADERSIIASAIDINYISHFVLRDMKRTYLPLVRDIMYISKHPEIPPYNWRSLELPVVEEIPEIISSLLASGVPVYTDDLEESTLRNNTKCCGLCMNGRR